MDTLQIRLSHGIVERIDKLVDTGIYSNRSDVVRDAVRKLVLEQMTGILIDETDSVEQIRNLRKAHSKESFDLDEINKLAE